MTRLASWVGHGLADICYYLYISLDACLARIMVNSIGRADNGGGKETKQLGHLLQLELTMVYLLADVFSFFRLCRCRDGQGKKAM